jgi:beta-lactamase regulating signal transducer with metallopeptidase domain
MELHFTNLVPDEIIKALCNTLIHSLWQGVILAVVTGVTIVLTKKSTAALRYNLMIGYLLLFTAAIAFTFYMELPAGQPNIAAHNAMPSPTALVQTIIVHQQVAEKPAGIISTGIGFFNTHANTIVLIWFLIICARCVQFAAGLQSIYYLKRSKVTAIGVYWEARVAALANNMAIKRTVTILQSGIAKLPMVIGHIKPVILIPVGLLTAMSAEEVEAVLLHELAHIKRKDYLVNLLQNLMEILFFFNPAVLWVSALIKTERENCCDDMVIAQTSSKVNYIKALVSCEEYRSAAPAYAMGLGGKDGHFLQRVKRMLSNNNQTLNRVEKMVLTVCLVFAVMVTAAFSKAGKTAGTSHPKLKNRVHFVAAAKNNPLPDAVNLQIRPAGIPAATPISVDTSKKARKSKNVTGEDVANELMAEGLIPDKEDFKFKINNDELSINGVKQSDDIFKNVIEKFAAPGNDSKFEINYTYHNNGKPASYNDARSSGRSYAYTSGGYSADHGGSQNSMSFSSGDHGVHMSNDNVSASPDYGRGPGQSYSAPYGDEKSKEIAYELLKEDLVKDKTHFTYHLSNDEFSIDGVKQSEELHRRIVDKFFKPGDKFNINYIVHDPGTDSYRSSAAGYQRQSDEQKRYWAGQQRKIVDEMMREGLVNDRNNVSFTLTDKTFVINGVVQSDEVFQRYHQEYAPAHTGDNWNWNYVNTPEVFSTNGWRSEDWDAYSRQQSEERRRSQDETDKKLVADLLQDGLITDADDVTFTLNYKEVTINGEKQSDAIHKKYQDKYMPATAGNGWNWTYSHHK